MRQVSDTSSCGPHGHNMHLAWRVRSPSDLCRRVAVLRGLVGDLCAHGLNLAGELGVVGTKLAFHLVVGLGALDRFLEFDVEDIVLVFEVGEPGVCVPLPVGVVRVVLLPCVELLLEVRVQQSAQIIEETRVVMPSCIGVAA